MKKQMTLMILIVLMAMMPFISASIENIGSVKQYDCISLPQTCNCTWNNITTVMYPNKTYITINQAMTGDGTYFNFTFCNTTDLGQYFVNGIGNKDGISTTFNYYFTVTPTGMSGNIGFYIFLSIVIIGILLIGIFLHNLELTLIGAMISAAWGIWTAFYGFDTFKNAGTEVLSIGIIALSLYWIGQAGIEYLGE